MPKGLKRIFDLFKNDYYSYLYTHIYQKHKKGTVPKCHGIYISAWRRYQAYFYQVSSLRWFYNWLFTDTPLSILVCELSSEHWDKLTKDEIKHYFHMLNLEINLMAASGLTLVLIIEASYSRPSLAHDFILYALKDNPFAEIHFNLKIPDNSKDKKEYDTILNSIIQNYESFSGYFYLYSPFFLTLKHVMKNSYF